MSKTVLERIFTSISWDFVANTTKVTSCLEAVFFCINRLKSSFYILLLLCHSCSKWSARLNIRHVKCMHAKNADTQSNTGVLHRISRHSRPRVQAICPKKKCWILSFLFGWWLHPEGGTNCLITDGQHAQSHNLSRISNLESSWMCNLTPII